MVFCYVSLWDLHKSLGLTLPLTGQRPTHKQTNQAVTQPFLVVTHKNQLRLIKVGRLVTPQAQLITIHTQATLELPILHQHHQIPGDENRL